MKKWVGKTLRLGLVALVSMIALALLTYWNWFRNPYHDNLRLDAATVMTFPVGKQGLLIQNANLVDVDRGIVVPDVTVLIRGETIEQIFIGDSPASNLGLVVIDARGKYLMPGLFEMHAHLGNGGIGGLEALESEVALEQFVLYGVTLVEEGQDLVPVLQRKTEAGLDGVKIVIESGPEPFYPKPRMSLELATKIVREANAVGLPVFVHISSADELSDAVRAGAKAVVHGVHDTLIDDADIELMRSGEIYYIPTLSIYGMDGRFKSDLQLDYVSKHALRSLNNPIFRFMVGRMDKKYGGGGATFETAENSLARLHAAGVPIALGSDTNMPFVFPGCSTHLEMQLMARAGLSNADVLRIATLGSAELLGIEDEVGDVASGHLANLIILEKNPLEDLRNTWTIDTVVLKGRVIEPAAGVDP